MSELHTGTMTGRRVNPLISLSAIDKKFLTDEVETHALSNIHLDIHYGEYVCISGPSGCGKSTLLSILGLLDPPSSGMFLLKGKPVTGIRPLERAQIRNREIGFIFQSFNLIGDLTVEENIALPLTYRSDMTNKDRRERIVEALDRVGMIHRRKHFPAQLSGGQQQRVAVARALAGRPSLLLADEPTGNLDSENGATVMALLERLHESGTTVCMVTHDARYAERAQRSVFMLDGRIVDEEVARHARAHLVPRLDEQALRAVAL